MNTPSDIRWRDLLLLALAASILLFPALGDIPFRRAEIYFADGGRNMVERGDWLVPYFNGEPFFDKPALTYWAISLSFKAFGLTLAASRLASAVAAVLVILTTAWLGWLLWRDRLSALAGGWILTATAAFMAFGRMAMSDMLLTLWVTLALALLVLCHRADRPPTAPVVLLAVVVALGFLTKGPIALVLPALAGLALLWSHGLRFRLPSAAVFAFATAVFAVAALSWFVAVYFRLGSGPLEFFFLRENLQRFSGEVHDAGRPVWFYMATYLGQGLPWSPFLALTVIRCVRRKSDSGVVWLLSWMLLVALLLTASHGKLDYYLLPLYPAASLAVGRYFRTVDWDRLERLCGSLALALAGAAALLLPLAGSALPPEWRPGIWAFGISSAVLVLVGVLCLSCAFRPRPVSTLALLVASILLMFFVLNASFLKAFYSGQPNGRVLADISTERRRRPDAVVASNGDPLALHRDLLFYNRARLEDSRTLVELAASSKPYLLLARADDAAALRGLPGVREVASYRYLTVRVLSLREGLGAVRPEKLELLANFGR